MNEVPNEVPNEVTSHDNEHSVPCIMPDCMAPLRLTWSYAYELFPADIEGDAPPQLLDHHASSWTVECLDGHVVLLPGPVGCCENNGYCDHVLAEYDWDEDNRTVTRHDMRRLRALDEMRRRGGICGYPAPMLLTQEAGTDRPLPPSVCELSYGHSSPWHESPNSMGDPMRWMELAP